LALFVKIAVVGIALAAIFAVSCSSIGVKVRISRLFHRWALSHMDTCEPRRRPVPNIVVDYFLQTATREWALAAGHFESDDMVAAIDVAGKLGLPPPRRFHLSLSHDQQDLLLEQATKRGRRM
jgi:hypothetical protein